MLRAVLVGMLREIAEKPRRRRICFCAEGLGTNEVLKQGRRPPRTPPRWASSVEGRRRKYFPLLARREGVGTPNLLIRSHRGLLPRVDLRKCTSDASGSS
jgi:hypothetical protein